MKLIHNTGTDRVIDLIRQHLNRLIFRRQQNDCLMDTDFLTVDRRNRAVLARKIACMKTFQPSWSGF